MSKIARLRQRISSAHVIALVALFVALGGSSYAAVTISASQIRNNSIPGSKLKSNSIPASKLRNNSITGRKLRNNTVSRAKLRSDALAPASGGGNITNPQSTTDEESSGSGPRGPQGPSGPRGLTGATGPAGPTGPAGQNGANGADGSNAGLRTVTNSVSTTEAGGTVTTSVSCNATEILYATNFVTDVVATAGGEVDEPKTTYTGTMTATGAATLSIYGLCGPR